MSDTTPTSTEAVVPAVASEVSAETPTATGPVTEVTATDLRRELKTVLKTVETGGQPVKVTRHGKVVAAVIGSTDLSVLEASKRAFASYGGILVALEHIQNEAELKNYSMSAAVAEPAPVPFDLEKKVAELEKAFVENGLITPERLAELKAEPKTFITADEGAAKLPDIDVDVPTTVFKVTRDQSVPPATDDSGNDSAPVSNSDLFPSKEEGGFLTE